MPQTEVAFFEPYPFKVGDKITITAGSRAGDWEIKDLTERKATLKCPISGREFDWDRFCYLVEKKAVEEWPHQD